MAPPAYGVHARHITDASAGPAVGQVTLCRIDARCAPPRGRRGHRACSLHSWASVLRKSVGRREKNIVRNAFQYRFLGNQVVIVATGQLEVCGERTKLPTRAEG